VNSSHHRRGNKCGHKKVREAETMAMEMVEVMESPPLLAVRHVAVASSPAGADLQQR
jgi:hypothetical protein